MAYAALYCGETCLACYSFGQHCKLAALSGKAATIAAAAEVTSPEARESSSKREGQQGWQVGFKQPRQQVGCRPLVLAHLNRQLHTLPLDIRPVLQGAWLSTLTRFEVPQHANGNEAVLTQLTVQEHC